MDQGTLLECFCLHIINHKAVSKQQNWKNGIIGKYGHFKQNNIKQFLYKYSTVFPYSKIFLLGCFL